MAEQPSLIGQQLGTYAILSLIGKGGMASVYRGFDQALQRPVAIKVLTVSAETQPEFIERFRQEARIIASLQHPHIVQVYTLGEHQDLVYIVQELLAGPTLGGYLKEHTAQRGHLARDAVLDILRQLAAALDAAHAAGIIHRDIKPDNAIWNAKGTLVLTDFGIARQLEGDVRHTRTGMIVGTPYYLSPEQAQGQPLSPASDVYALGVVLYEMLAGKVPFEGPTPMSVVLGHIQNEPPPLRTVRPDLPPAVEQVVHRAMAKDPAARFGSAGALAQALERAWTDATVVPGAAPSADVHDQSTRAWTGATRRPSQPAQAGPATRRLSESAPPPAGPPSQSRAAAPAAPVRRSQSPLVLVAGVLLLLLLLGGAAFALFGSSGDAGEESAIIPPADTTETPTASPTVTITPEAAAPTAEPPSATPEPAPGGASSLPTGRLVFASRRSGDGDIYAINTDGSGLQQLTNDGAGDFAPAWSPDGQAIAFHSGRNGEDDIYVINADGSGLRRVTVNNEHDRDPAWSPDGRQFAFYTGRDRNWEIYTMNIDGSEPRNLTNDFADDFAPVWSPDGQAIAFTSNRDGNDEVYVMNADGSNQRNLTSHPDDDLLPAWSPDGTQIAFVSERDGNGEIYLMNVDGSNLRNLTNHPSQDTQPIWSPDGQFIAFTANRDGNDEMYIMDADGSNPRRVTRHESSEWDASWAR